MEAISKFESEELSKPLIVPELQIVIRRVDAAEVQTDEPRKDEVASTLAEI